MYGKKEGGRKERKRDVVGKGEDVGKEGLQMEKRGWWANSGRGCGCWWLVLCV